ncbi:hypothetical protein QOT38_29780, partial [Pseudomonas aeruginosa]
MGGRITVESVVRCSWNGWPDDRGIRKLPAFSCGWYAHPLIQGLIVLVFASSGVYAIASALGMLPASW